MNSLPETNGDPNWEEQLTDLVCNLYQTDATGHDYYHSLRVRRMALRLQQNEGGDPDVLSAAAYLHDVGRVLNLETKDHALTAAEAAPRFLTEIGFPQDKFRQVIGCIRYHDHYAEGIPEEWHDVMEILIFQDADRLDAIGAIGIARTFTYGGATGKPIWVPGSQIQHSEWTANTQSQNTIIHFYEKLLKIDTYLNTATAQLIAAGRIAYMRAFLDRFFQEWEGDA